MDGGVRSRILLVACLATAGIVPVGAGTALGVGGAFDSPQETRVTVSETQVAVSDGEREITVVEQMSDVRAVEISESRGTIAVETRAYEGLTAAERERAVAVARENTTVRRFLAGMEGYELAVEPVVELESTSADARYSVTVGGNGSISGDPETFEVAAVDTTGTGSDSVTVRRERSYEDDRAVVEIRRPGADRAVYWVTVDLRNGTVVDTTDWRD